MAPPNTLAEGSTWGALGAAYTNLLSLLHNAYAHLSGLQNTTITTQNAQIIRLQRVLEAVLGELTKMKVDLHEVERDQRVEDREAKVREELGRLFISELARSAPPWPPRSSAWPGADGARRPRVRVA